MSHTSMKPSAPKWRWRLALLTLATSTALPLSDLIAQERSSTRYTDTVRAIERAEPAVVNIEGNKVSRSSGRSMSSEQNVNGMGAGVIIDPRGYILTNQHVVQDVRRIDVTMHDGTQFVGRLIARDADTDLAVIKVDADRDLPVIPCGTSSDLMRGERVVAIGNPFGYHDSVTEGIISALHRNIPVNGVQEYPDLIQTDASINPGNSGGPLLNADGMMVGINAAVRIGAQGIGFAIPIDRAIEIAANMIAKNEGNSTGLVVVKSEYLKGQPLVRVVRCSSGDLRPNDIVRRVGDRDIKNRLDYELALVGSNSQVVNLTVERDGELKSATMGLAAQSPSSTKSSNLRLASSNATESAAYRELGLELTPADPSVVRQTDKTYEGGMQIVNIRPGSPAQKAELKRGDILVGLVGWQPTSWEDIDYILKSKEWQTTNKPQIHIIRGKKIYTNNLDLSLSRTR